MTGHKTGTREEWLAARLQLLDAEKALTRRSDEVARQRQELPWVRIDREYQFDTDEGPASLADLFRGRSQLLVYHFMFGPGPCPTHRSEATVLVEEGAGFNAPVTINPCRAGCTPEGIMGVLGLNGHARPTEQWRRMKASLDVRKFGSPDGAGQYLRVVAALFAQGLDGRRSDVDGVRGEGRTSARCAGRRATGTG